jgi:uncharacterized membrane protein YkvA (DUF1232 family)
MATILRTMFSTPSLVRAFFSHARLSWRLIREPRVPVFVKAVPALAALYLVSPLDIMPDVLPIMGQLDDLAIALMALQLFQRLCPPRAVEFHRAALTSRRPFSPMPGPPATGDIIDI